MIDSLLALSNLLATSSLKAFFGLANVTLDTDFVNALHIPLSSWQGRNWDSDVGSSAFFELCDAITEEKASLSVGEEEKGAEGAMLIDLIEEAFPSWPSDPRKAFASFSAYAEYTKKNVASMCSPEMKQDDCFGTSMYAGDGLEEAGALASRSLVSTR